MWVSNWGSAVPEKDAAWGPPREWLGTPAGCTFRAGGCLGPGSFWAAEPGGFAFLPFRRENPSVPFSVGAAGQRPRAQRLRCGLLLCPFRLAQCFAFPPPNFTMVKGDKSRGEGG